MRNLKCILIIVVLSILTSNSCYSENWMYSTPEEYFNAFKKYMKLDQPEKADSVMEEMLKHYPNNAEALFYKAGLLFHEEQYAKAKTLLENCIVHNQQYDKAFWYLGMIYAINDKDREAEEYYKKALEINGASAARGQLAELYASQGKFELAERENNLYFKYVKNPGQYDYIVSAYIYEHLGKDELLVEACEKALDVGDPRNVDVLLTLCPAYEKTGKLEKAWLRYEYSHSWFPTVPEFKEGFIRTTKSFAEELSKSNDLAKLKEYEKVFTQDAQHYKNMPELEYAINKVKFRIKELSKKKGDEYIEE